MKMTETQKENNTNTIGVVLEPAGTSALAKALRRHKYHVLEMYRCKFAQFNAVLQQPIKGFDNLVE